MPKSTPAAGARVNLTLPAPAPSSPQLRLALYWNAADLRRPDHALYRELLDAFAIRGDARAIAWEIWSTADRRTGLTPDWVTAAWCGERLGLTTNDQRKKRIYPGLRKLDACAIVLQARPSRRAPAVYRVNIAALYRRRRREAKRPETGPEQANLLSASGAYTAPLEAPSGAPGAPLEAPSGAYTAPPLEGTYGNGSQAAAGTDDQQQQQRARERADGLFRAIARLYRLAGERYDLDEESRRFDAGEFTVDDLQRHHDEALAIVEQRRSR